MKRPTFSLSIVARNEPFARYSVWPAIWPAGVMTASVYLTRDRLPLSLFAVTAEMAAACLIYVAVFVAFGISREERHFYLMKTLDLVQRRPLRVPLSESA